MVELDGKISREERERKVLSIAKRLAMRGYRFSTYQNLARAIYDESLSSLLEGSNDDYIGLCPNLIREVLLKHKEEVDAIFKSREVGECVG